MKVKGWAVGMKTTDKGVLLRLWEVGGTPFSSQTILGKIHV